MTTHANSHKPPETPVERMMNLHLAWHQLWWQVPMTYCGAGWLTSHKAPPVGVVEPLAAHDQLAVPPEIEGDHALFA